MTRKGWLRAAATAAAAALSYRGLRGPDQRRRFGGGEQPGRLG